MGETSYSVYFQESGLQPSPDIADGSASSRDSVAVAASNSAPSITTAVRKRRSPDRTRRKTVGDCNGILQNNNMVLLQHFFLF